MSEKDPFSKAPDADSAFAYGENPATSLPIATKVIAEAQRLTREDPYHASRIHRPAIDAVLGRGEENAIADVNMFKVTEARNNVAERDRQTENFRRDIAIGRPPSREAARQAGIAAADRDNRAKAGLPPREYDLR